MAKPYRSRSRLVLDVLRAVRGEGKAQVTRLLMVANLTHPRLMEHLEPLVAKGWLAESSEDGRKSWSLTPAGQAALRQLESMEEALMDLGLAM
jgi:predicted transcriptional regulator